ncbi:MAG: HAD family phosphatase [Cytophagaceae bacterium]|jgi:putative hydrolase of the HAD superfamily|nr:HAD family phosphatase [Cytophagaceae bacterium]
MLLFDLGAVIIPIDFSKTFRAFATLSGKSTEEIQQLYLHHQEDTFLAFEKGQIGNHQFFNQVRSLLQLSPTITNDQVVAAWNALLLDIPKERIERLQKLQQQHTLCLLSNTNPIHIQEVNRILYKCTGVAMLEDLFSHTFYSYDMGLVKPFPDIYRYVSHHQDCPLNTITFFDDHPDNVKGAAAVGIHSVTITPSYDILHATESYIN